MLQLRMEDQKDCEWTWAFSCDGNGCLAAMEHEAGIEWVPGLRLGSRHGFGSGCGFGSGY